MAMTMPTLIEPILMANKKLLDGTWVASNKANKQWMVIKITESHTSKQTVTYESRIYLDGTSGKLKSISAIGTDTIAQPSEMPLIVGTFKSRAAKGKSYEAAQKALKEWLTTTPDTSEDDFVEYVSTDTPVLPIPSVEGGRWNPPNHSATRGLPFYVTAGIKTASPLSPSQEYLIETAVKYSDNLGKIYQTTSSAKALNAKTLTRQRKTGKVLVMPKDLWGFRFCYNPTTITYSTTVDSSIDWMLAPSDPSKFFGGNTSVTFDLYLNRIVDMSTLRRPNYQSSYVGSNLTEEQKQGILTRGTEYDIEYLYRVVNGNPKEGTKLLSDATAKTADYGYITGMPFWLQLHENMIFKASLSGFSVNHVMFTEKMVPMFTVVTLSFIRYPEPNTTADAREALTNYQKTGLNS